MQKYIPLMAASLLVVLVGCSKPAGQVANSIQRDLLMKDWTDVELTTFDTYVNVSANKRLYKYKTSVDLNTKSLGIAVYHTPTSRKIGLISIGKTNGGIHHAATSPEDKEKLQELTKEALEFSDICFKHAG